MTGARDTGADVDFAPKTAAGRKRLEGPYCSYQLAMPAASVLDPYTRVLASVADGTALHPTLPLPACPLPREGAVRQERGGSLMHVCPASCPSVLRARADRALSGNRPQRSQRRASPSPRVPPGESRYLACSGAACARRAFSSPSPLRCGPQSRSWVAGYTLGWRACACCQYAGRQRGPD